MEGDKKVGLNSNYVMPVIETFMTWGLPVLQSLVATGISEVALRNLYADDGSDNDAFRKIMR